MYSEGVEVNEGKGRGVGNGSSRDVTYVTGGTKKGTGGGHRSHSDNYSHTVLQ